MRGFAPDEKWALGVLNGPPATFKEGTEDNHRLDFVLPAMVERGCARFDGEDYRGSFYSVTELGRIAWRLCQVPT